MMLFTNRSGWHQQLAGLADGLTFKTRADYDNYLKRLAAYPALNDEALKISTRALNEGYVLPCVALDGFEETIIGRDPRRCHQVAALCAVRGGAAGGGAGGANGARLQGRAQALIDGDLRARLCQASRLVLGAATSPNAQPAIGVSALPNGKAYYAYKIRTPDDHQPHRRGHPPARPERGQADPRRDGGRSRRRPASPSREAMIADLRTNPKYYAKTPEELMAATARELKKIDGKMPTLFTLLPRLPYGIREIPAEIAPGTTTAYYNQRIARERHRRHLLRQHLEARPAAAVGNPGADGA